MASQRKAGALLGYANILAKNLVNLVYTPMLLSYVGQADYGVFQSSNSFVFSLTLLSFGFSEAYVRFYTQTVAHGGERDIRHLNGMYLTLYVAVTAAAVALGMGFSANAGAVFSAGFTEAQVSLARELLAIMTLNVASTLFTVVFNSYITAHERFVYQQTRQLVTTLATPLCAWALLAAGMGPVGVALAQLAVNLVLLALNARYAIVVLGMRFELRGADWGVMRGIAAFSAWIFGNQVCEMVNQSVPNIMLGAISGATAVSLFAVAVNIRQVFYSLSTTMSNVFIPKVNRIVATSDDNAELTRLMTRVGRYQMVLFCWVYGGFAILGKFFVTRWAGPGFAEAYWLHDATRHGAPLSERRHRDPEGQEHAPRQESRLPCDGGWERCLHRRGRPGAGAVGPRDRLCRQHRARQRTVDELVLPEAGRSRHALFLEAEPAGAARLGCRHSRLPRWHGGPARQRMARVPRVGRRLQRAFRRRPLARRPNEGRTYRGRLSSPVP